MLVHPVFRKPGLHISGKDRKHMVANTFLAFHVACSSHVVMIAGINISQEIFAVDVLTALKSSLKHRRKHVLRLLQLYGEGEGLTEVFT